MLARVRSAAVLGIDAYPVEVEVDLSSGLPSFTTVGLPHGAVKEGRERINAALVNSGFEFPLKRITANLAPADIRKEGSAFDLPIAVGILAASGQIDPGGLTDGFLFGELGLEGALRTVRGVLSMVACAHAAGARWVIVPAPNGPEAGLVAGVRVYAAETLGALVAHLNGGRPLPEPVREAPAAGIRRDDADFRDVRGQAVAKRALEVAAAGNHNVLMVGPPGSGKTMLARRLPSILPDLTPEEALDVTKVHSVAGLLGGDAALRAARPFRAPHHTISDAGLAGGGSHPRPGEISLAHHGVLFLDELPEFRRNVLEVLRQPLEDGVVTLARASTALSFPARFLLVAAMNPCPCGYHGDLTRACRCTEEAVSRYLGRISGPLYDRFDIQLPVPSVGWSEMVGLELGESSEAIRGRVERARARQRQRSGSGPAANAYLSARQLRLWCRTSPEVNALLSKAAERLGFTARAINRVLKIARTIADLRGAESIEPADAAEALQYRNLDRVMGRGLRPPVAPGNPRAG